jgi:hypothetical protein
MEIKEKFQIDGATFQAKFLHKFPDFLFQRKKIIRTQLQ